MAASAPGGSVEATGSSLAGMSSTGSAPNALEQLVLQFLQTRGYTRAEELLRKEMAEGGGAWGSANGATTAGGTGASGSMAGNTLSVEELAAKTGLHMSRLEKEGGTATSVPSNGVTATIGHLQEEVSLVLMGDPTVYDAEYTKLRNWIETSLDLYKPELQSALWPVFVHCYLDLVEKLHLDAASHFLTKHRSDHALQESTISSLSHVTLPHHLETSSLAQAYRSMRYRIRLSRVSFDLLIHYLSERSSSKIGDRVLGNPMMIIFNDHLEIQLVETTPSKARSSIFLQGIGLVGLDSDPKAPAVTKAEVEVQPLKLGPLTPDAVTRDEIDRALAAEDKDEEEQQKGESNAMAEDGVNEEEKIREESKRRHKASLVSLYSEMKPDPKVSPSVYADSPSPTDLALPPSRLVDIQREVEIVKEYRSRMKLGPKYENALPSVCAYTFHNTYDGLNCITFSDDSTMTATGFGESYIRLFSMSGKKFRGMRSDFTPAHIHDSTQLRNIREKTGYDSKRLIGHSGPVYGLSFSPDQQFLMSCSEDRTARLWSMDTLTNVAVYRGHNYPIWDISFSPQGYYFATASNDRTARLWTTDRISPLRLFAGHISDVECVRFHPNSLYLATGSADRTARLWDVQRGACVRVLTGHSGSVTTLTMSPDGRTLATADESNVIRIWDLGMGTCIKRMEGHTAAIHSMSFNQESNMLVSGSSDYTVKTWNVLQGDEDKSLLATFYTRQTPIYATQCTRRNLFLVAGPYQGADA